VTEAQLQLQKLALMWDREVQKTDGKILEQRGLHAHSPLPSKRFIPLQQDMNYKDTNPVTQKFNPIIHHS